MKTRRTRVYVAGPYSSDPTANTNRAIAVGDMLWQEGYAPLIPHLTHFWHAMHPHPYVEWLEYDNQFLPCCDVVLRIPGESSGADKEVDLATSLGMEVFHSIEELKDHVDPITVVYRDPLGRHPGHKC